MHHAPLPRDDEGFIDQPRLPPPPPLPVDASLFLDFDGTLVEIASHPDAVVVDDRLRGMLARLVGVMPGRVAVISGRPIAELDRFLGPLAVALGGSHGLELRWPDGRAASPPVPDLEAVGDAMRDLARRHPGVIVEPKPFGVALHYRGAPTAADACRRLATALAGSNGLSLQTGKMVFELRVAGSDKGSALATLHADPAMAGTVPVFIGDDDTDEAAFIAAAELGGAGVLVGPLRPTAARYRLDSVAATLDWLDTASGDAS